MASDSLEKIRVIFGDEMRGVRAELDACRAHITACAESGEGSTGDTGWQRKLIMRLEECRERLRGLAGMLESLDEERRTAEKDVAETIELLYRAFPGSLTDGGDDDYSASSISPLA